MRTLAIALVLWGGVSVSGQTWDLRSDWSNSNNPNGVWTYREGTNALPFVASWQSALGGWTSPQPGWADSENGNNRLPFWFRSNGAEDFTRDWVSGDIVVHTWDSVNGVGNGEANVIWTAPVATVVNLSGGAWLGRDIGRSVRWELYLNANLLSQGNLFTGDTFNRASPFLFSNGTGGPGAINNLAVNPGDVVTLQYVTTSSAGDFVGMNFTVSTIPEPATLGLAGAGLIGSLLMVRRRRSKRKQRAQKQ